MRSSAATNNARTVVAADCRERGHERGHGRQSDMDDVLYCLMWVAARRLAAVPLAVEEVNRPADFIAAHTGVSAEIIRMVIEFLDRVARDDY